MWLAVLIVWVVVIPVAVVIGGYWLAGRRQARCAALAARRLERATIRH